MSDQPLTRAQIHRRIDKRLGRFMTSPGLALIKQHAKGMTAGELEALIQSVEEENPGCQALAELATEAAAGTGLTYGEAYDALEGLIDKGLIDVKVRRVL